MSAWKGLSILAALLLLAPASNADSFYEDFLSKEYCDEANTTAWWDTILGEIKPWNLDPYWVSGFPLAAQVDGLARAGNHLFVSTTGINELSVFDVSDPFVLTHLTTLPPTPDMPVDLFVHGNVLYVAENGAGFRVYDISDPTVPVDMGVHPYVGDARRLEVFGDRLYIAGGVHGLHLYDISNPFSPAFINHWETAGPIADVDVTGEYVYVAVEGLYGEGFYILTNPEDGNFTYVGDVIDDTGFLNIEVSGDRVYASDAIGNLKVFDVSDPVFPLGLGGWFSGGGPIEEFEMDGSTAYAICDLGAFVVDMADSYSPQVLAQYNDVNGLSMLPYGEFMFIGTFWDGIQTLGVSQRVGPHFGGELDHGLDTGIYHIDYQGDFAYVADTGLHVLDISDPWAPVWRGTGNSAGYVTGLAVDGNYAYTPAWSVGLDVQDISDPDFPTVVLSVPWGLCHPTAIELAGHHAYVMAWEGLKVYDISDPLSTHEVAYLPMAVFGWHHIAIQGDILYASMHANGLLVVDISDPTIPVSLGINSMPCWDIAVHGDFAYLAAEIEGVRVLDITDPALIQHIDYVATEYSITAIDIAGNYALAATDQPGMIYLDLTDPALPTVIPGLDLSGNNYGGSWEISDYGGHFYMGVDSVGLIHRQLFEFEVDKIDVEFVSLPIDDEPHEIEKLRFDIDDSAWDTGWSIDTGSGNGFEEIEPGGDWKSVFPGPDLRWKCLIPPEELLGGPPPACGWLDISWLYQVPIILSVEDVPNDEGLQIDISWQRSARDFEDEVDPVVYYEVWRRFSDESRWAWDSLASIDAAAQDSYTATVPTYVDSTEHEEGLFVYRVTAHLTDPSEFFESPPDSGWSVDNFVPPPPSFFDVAYHPYDGNHLTWGECEAPDFLFYTIYRDTLPDFTPTGDNILQLSFDQELVDDAGEDWNRVFYKISATDDAWQESEYLAPEVTDVETPPARFALYQNLPNPFNPTTTIMFEVPTSSGHVKLSVYDVSGRLLRVLRDKHYEAGRYEAEWNGRDARGQVLPSGVYFYRLDAEDFGETKKMVLVK